jgi:hypothetical protein
VPDNPKALIANPDRYEPRANDTVLEFAKHYNTSVLPARPRRPQDVPDQARALIKVISTFGSWLPAIKISGSTEKLLFLQERFCSRISSFYKLILASLARQAEGKHRKEIVVNT